MNGTVAFVVKVFGVIQHEAVAHISTEVLAIKVVVPCATAFRYHKETQELNAQDHLNPLI